MHTAPEEKGLKDVEGESHWNSVKKHAAVTRALRLPRLTHGANVVHVSEIESAERDGKNNAQLHNAQSQKETRRNTNNSR